MAKVRIRVTRQNSKYKEAIKGYEDKARRVVAYGLNEVRDIAVKGIAGGNKSGITYTRRGVSHTASAAGEYPAGDTGVLQNNIFADVDSNGLGGSVESRAQYSEFLEFGHRARDGTFVEARPFMQPSAEQARPRIRRRLKEIFR
tara:strand:+ start:1170 stop:1601 length:432 start_codon:yes stop_codon:yes gene_type:complete